MRLLLLASTLAFAAPSFLNEKTVKHGHVLKVSCEGVGPDQSTAKVAALSNCRLVASDFLKQRITVKNTSVQTESDSALHSLVQSEVTTSNFMCKAIKEECEDGDNQSKCYLRCEFDLSETISESSPDKEKTSLENLSEAEDKKIELKSNNSVKSSRRSYSISTIPRCQTILIEGKFSRIVQCSQNPVAVTLEETDRTLVIRADKYKPKTIRVKDLLSDEGEEIQVVLSK